MIRDVLIVACLVLAACAAGYIGGYLHAGATGQALMAEREAELEGAKAEALRLAQAALREEARRAFLADFALQQERNAHAQEKEKLLERVPAAVGGSDHAFSPDFVGLWNDALRPCAGALPASSGSPGADAEAGAAACAVRRGHRD